jgi:hypothetical protein
MIGLPLVSTVVLAAAVVEARDARAPEVASVSAESAMSSGPSWTPPVAHTLTLFTVTRVAEAYLYPHPFAETSTFGEHYGEAFTRPPLFDTSQPAFRWDYDPLVINLVGHALMGSEIHLRARSCRFSAAGALAFTAVSSVVWEYGFEGNGVRPSAQDLVYTPLAGLILGEARYLGVRAADSFSSTTARGVLRAVLDPFGEMERRVGLFDC